MHGDPSWRAQLLSPANRRPYGASGTPRSPRDSISYPAWPAFASSQFTASMHGSHPRRHPGALGFLPHLVSTKAESSAPHQSLVSTLCCFKVSLDSLGELSASRDALDFSLNLSGFFVANSYQKPLPYPCSGDRLRDPRPCSLCPDLLNFFFLVVKNVNQALLAEPQVGKFTCSLRPFKKYILSKHVSS